MKRIVYVILTVAIVLSLSSCATHFGLTSNLNNSTTNVILQTNNYKIIKKVKGTASGTSVFGIGGSFKPLIEQARSEMLSSANLIGKPRAVINETVEINNKSYVGIVNVHTVTVSAYVVEFTNSGVVEEDDEATIITPAAKETSLNSTETIINSGLTGKWISKNNDFEITIDGNFGVFSQINSGIWLSLLEKRKIQIGDPKFKNIILMEEMIWKCKEKVKTDYILSISPFWTTSYLKLDETGNILTVYNDYVKYTLTKIE